MCELWIFISRSVWTNAGYVSAEDSFICKCQPALISKSLKWVSLFVSEVQFQKLMQLSSICISSGQVKVLLVAASVWVVSPRGQCILFKPWALWAKQLWLSSYLSWLGSAASHRKNVTVDLLPLGFDIRGKGQRVWKMKFKKWGWKCCTPRESWPGGAQVRCTLLFRGTLPWSIPPSAACSYGNWIYWVVQASSAPQGLRGHGIDSLISVWEVVKKNPLVNIV